MQANKHNSGFTLIELMIVVVILGILAAVAITAYGEYVKQSRKAEATTVLADIRVKQEAYLGAFHRYADLSANNCPWVPNGTPGGNSHGNWDWPTNCETNWNQLGASLGKNIYYSYWGEAKGPEENPTHTFTPYQNVVKANNAGWWYGAMAAEDLDGDKQYAGFFVVSGVAAVYDIEEGENFVPSP